MDDVSSWDQASWGGSGSGGGGGGDAGRGDGAGADWDDNARLDDDELGPLVRPYTVTRGRTRVGSHDLQVITMVSARQPLDQLVGVRLDHEQRQILTWCQHPLSLAEISSHLRLPLGVVKILVADLIERDLMVFRSAVTPDIGVLQAVIAGIRRL